jgi:small GTP-binding protein
MRSTTEFEFDVFLSHSEQDRAVACAIAERLRADGLRVWFHAWEIKPGENVSAKIEYGLEHSRVLVFCMSKGAFGDDWVHLEVSSLRFRDPLNNERRFVPLRLDDSQINASIAHFLYINWLPSQSKQEYEKLLEACRPPVKQMQVEAATARKQFAVKTVQFDCQAAVIAYAFSPNRTHALTAEEKTAGLWDVETGRCLRVLEGHTDDIWCVAWSADQRRALTGAEDRTMRLWDVEMGQCLRIFEGHQDTVLALALSANRNRALSGSGDNTVRLWDVETGKCLRVLRGHNEGVYGLVWTADERHVLTGSDDNTVRLWDIEKERCTHTLEGHTGGINCLELSADQRFALSGADDGTLRYWDLATGRCLQVLSGHSQCIWSVAWSRDQRLALSGSDDNTVRLWEVETGRCLRVLEGHTEEVYGVAWSADQCRAYSGDVTGNVRIWDLSGVFSEVAAPGVPVPVLRSEANQVQYTNAKVLLVGEGDAGKTGLSKRLAWGTWEHSDKTVGAWATHWKLPVGSGEGVEREIWLWDFGGQADQRLIHQLYMEETALAVLVFDGQREDLFEKLGQWDRDLARAAGKGFTKLLAAGRVDLCPLRVSHNQIEAFATAHGFRGFFETSAKVGTGCDILKSAVLAGIRWEDISWRSSPLLFKRLTEEIVRLKDMGRVLMRFNELRETLQLRLSGEIAHFADDELKAVISLLAGPAVVWELKFGSWVLLQPELINACAQAVIKTMSVDKYERGCIEEERVLNGDLIHASSMPKIEADEERIILFAMHQMLVKRSLCLRQHTEKGTLLVFPSYYRRKRSNPAKCPPSLVSYRFNGFLDDIYATLVVRLHHTEPFEQQELWSNAADFRTLTRKQLGVKLTPLGEGAGELEVYFDPTIPMEEKIIFSKYVHEHLLKCATDVVRLRNYVCPHCGHPVKDRELAMELLAENGKGARIKCQKCRKWVSLWDHLEDRFAAPDVQQSVQNLVSQSQIVLDSTDKERTLVGEVISATALAGQICREMPPPDYGIDAEIEFKSDSGKATGRKLYLQLKSGDAYLKRRKSDGAEIFRIPKPRHVKYWMDQAFPVFLVIRNSKGQARWMEVQDYLKRESDYGKKAVKQIVFDGERFDVISIRRWRDKILAQSALQAHRLSS